MSKSIKLQNNVYWDSEGIIHNKKTLKDILGLYPLKSYGEVWTGVDMNNYKDNGVLTIGVPVDETNHTNLPTSNGGTLVVFGHTQWGFQLYVPYAVDSSLYFRNHFGGNWSSWKKII